MVICYSTSNRVCIVIHVNKQTSSLLNNNYYFTLSDHQLINYLIEFVMQCYKKQLADKFVVQISIANLPSLEVWKSIIAED